MVKCFKDGFALKVKVILNAGTNNGKSAYLTAVKTDIYILHFFVLQMYMYLMIFFTPGNRYYFVGGNIIWLIASTC